LDGIHKHRQKESAAAAAAAVSCDSNKHRHRHNRRRCIVGDSVSKKTDKKSSTQGLVFTGLALGTGLILILIPEPATTLTGLAIVAATVGVQVVGGK